MKQVMSVSINYCGLETWVQSFAKNFEKKRPLEICGLSRAQNTNNLLRNPHISVEI
jgi:hypothetical protein